MTENKCKSLENLLPIVTAKLSHTQFPLHFETYRTQLHHEMAMRWPFRPNIPDSTNIAQTISKSTAHSSIRDGPKSNLTPTGKDTVHPTVSHLRSKNLPSSNHPGPSRKTVEANIHLKPTISEFSLDERDPSIEWSLKAQEGVITYQLPDSLPDGLALHNKLQKLMKTDTMHLNDRRFWTTLENRFKTLEKQSFQQNMQRLRRSQQQYEQELISKGVMPHTTEQAVQQYAEQRQKQVVTNKVDADTSHRKKCFIDYIPSNKNVDDNLMNENETLEAFESDNVHPRLHEVLHDYKYQTKSGKELSERFEHDLYRSQIQIKTIFPKLNQRDRIRQELEAVKTSEGLYAYSNHLAKQISK